MNSEACRACLSVKEEPNDEFKDLFSNADVFDGKTYKFSELLMECAPLQINDDDNLPNLICYNCVKKLEITYSFRQMCIISDSHLKLKIETLIKNEETPGVKNEYHETDNTFHEENYDSENIKPNLDNIDNSAVAKCEENDVKHFPSEKNDLKVKNIHYRKRHSKRVLYKCVTCNKRFITKDQLLQHKRKTHPLEDIQLFLDGFAKLIEDEVFKCDYCKEKFDTNDTLENHITQRMCKKQAKRSKGPFICDVCNKQFESNPSLRNHARIHSGERPYVCEICGKGFKQNSHLAVHKKVHSGEKFFMCDICSKSYITNSALKKHMEKHFKSVVRPKIRKTTPRELRKFSCKQCMRSFKKHSTYVQHMRTHTDEAPYMCERCGATFKHASQMRLHKLSHTGVKPHMCVACDKAFLTASELRVHSIAHTDERPHKCDYCEQRFKYRITAWRHMMYHTGEKPHKCSVCDKAFLEAGPLRRHMRVHTGERPNQCAICYKAFKETTHLKTHMKIHKTD